MCWNVLKSVLRSDGFADGPLSLSQQSDAEGWSLAVAAVAVAALVVLVVPSFTRAWGLRRKWPRWEFRGGGIAVTRPAPPSHTLLSDDCLLHRPVQRDAAAKTFSPERLTHELWAVKFTKSSITTPCSSWAPPQLLLSSSISFHHQESRWSFRHIFVSITEKPTRGRFLIVVCLMDEASALHWAERRWRTLWALSPVFKWYSSKSTEVISAFT